MAICACPACAIAAGGTGCWMITWEVEVIGWMSVGICSPWIAACLMIGRTR